MNCYRLRKLPKIRTYKTVFKSYSEIFFTGIIGIIGREDFL